MGVSGAAKFKWRQRSLKGYNFHESTCFFEIDDSAAALIETLGRSSKMRTRSLSREENSDHFS